jgi:ribosome biogenesis GTPase / thiamine phosphate phosphatase
LPNQQDIVSKNKLSKNQKRRVQANHEQRRKLTSQALHKELTEKDVAPPDTLFGDAHEGLVISRYGKLADVEDRLGHIHRCNIRRTLPSLVTGDRVVWRPSLDGHTNGIIEAVQERKTEFMRPDFYDGVKTVAANVDQIIIVSAVVPELSLNIIDRYLVACETMRIKPIIVLNKVDLLSTDQRQRMADKLAIYQDIGYQTLFVSKQTGEGIAELRTRLQDHVSIFVGQSGVGKSSLINLFLPERLQPANIGEISQASRLGQHTTTTAKLYHLVEGGSIIDSPGVREFGLWHLEPAQISQGFIEFAPYLGTCQFRDCTHQHDPGCALQQAVGQNKISATRFENYHRILQSMAEILAKSHRHYNK